MNTASTDPYVVLGVPTNASLEEIKRAYFRLVKTHRPDRDPEGFERIRRAYEMLSDPETRRAYDAMRQHGEAIAGLLKKAEELMQKQHWKEALNPLKHILLLWSDAEVALHYLGLCYLNLEQWSEACGVFEKLTRLKPGVALYWTYLGESFLGRGLAADGGGPHRYFERAREACKRAADIEPYNSQPRVLIARTYVLEGNLDEAEKWLERGISADNKLDEFDVVPLLELCVIHAIRNDSRRLGNTVSRLETIVRQSQIPDINAFVGFSLARHAVELAKVGSLLPASQLVDAALRFVPNDRELKEFQRHLRQATSGNNQSGAGADAAAGCGCALAILCAILGAAVGHLPGFLIGAWIGLAIARAIAGGR